MFDDFDLNINPEEYEDYDIEAMQREVDEWREEHESEE